MAQVHTTNHTFTYTQ